MKFTVGLIAGFMFAHLKSGSEVANKLADGLEIVADKLHAWAHPDEEQE
jgi:hypothetical protein